MAAAKIKLWLLLEAKIECCAGLRTLIMPKATEGQMFTVTHQYKKSQFNAVPLQNVRLTFAVRAWLYLALRLNCAAQTNP